MRKEIYGNKPYKLERRKLIRAKASAQMAWMAPDKESVQSAGGNRNSSNRKG